MPNGELTLKTYEVATNRLNAVDQWAHNFVNLYFVFCAALIAATGYAVTIDEKNKLCLYPFNSQITARQFFYLGRVNDWAACFRTGFDNGIGMVPAPQT